MIDTLVYPLLMSYQLLQGVMLRSQRRCPDFGWQERAAQEQGAGQEASAFVMSVPGAGEYRLVVPWPRKSGGVTNRIAGASDLANSFDSASARPAVDTPLPNELPQIRWPPPPPPP